MQEETEWRCYASRQAVRHIAEGITGVWRLLFREPLDKQLQSRPRETPESPRATYWSRPSQGRAYENSSPASGSEQAPKPLLCLLSKGLAQAMGAHVSHSL